MTGVSIGFAVALTVLPGPLSTVQAQAPAAEAWAGPGLFSLAVRAGAGAAVGWAIDRGRKGEEVLFERTAESGRQSGRFLIASDVSTLNWRKLE